MHRRLAWVIPDDVARVCPPGRSTVLCEFRTLPLTLEVMTSSIAFDAHANGRTDDAVWRAAPWIGRERVMPAGMANKAGGYPPTWSALSIIARGRIVDDAR